MPPQDPTSADQFWVAVSVFGFMGLAILVSMMCALAMPHVIAPMRRVLLVLGGLGVSITLLSVISRLSQPPFALYGPHTTPQLSGLVIWLVFLTVCMGLYRWRR